MKTASSIDVPEGLRQPTRPPSPQQQLFDVEPNWREHWWGMPSFEMEDCRPAHQITVSFMTREDVDEFKARLGVKRVPRPDFMWYPQQQYRKQIQWGYVDG